MLTDYMELFQLKPSYESFYRIARGIVKSFSSIITCEGNREAEVIKAIARKLGITYSGRVAITHGEGIPSIYELTSYIIVLARLSRKLRAIGVIVDSEEKTPYQRFQSIIDSLRSRLNHDIEVTEEDRENNFYQINIVLNGKSIPVLIAVSGIPKFKFNKHKLEEHILELMQLEGKIDQKYIDTLNDSKDAFKNTEEVINIMEESETENIEKAFKHITKLLKKIKQIIEV